MVHYNGDAKACTRCGDTKPLSDFPPCNQSRSGREPRCRDCRRAELKARYRADADYRERLKAGARSQYHEICKDPKRRQELAERRREYKREYDSRTSIEARRDYKRQWRLANPDKVVAQAHRRRTSKTAAGGSFTAEEWQALKAKYDHRCLACGRREPDISLTFDHVVPVSKGGSSDISNGQPLCMSDNSRKRDQIIDYRPTEAAA